MADLQERQHAISKHAMDGVPKNKSISYVINVIKLLVDIIVTQGICKVLDQG
jgi:hypothetical protein